MKRFVEQWLKGKSVADVANALGISIERACVLAAKCRRKGLPLRVLPEEIQNVRACCQEVYSAAEMEQVIEQATGLQMSSSMTDFLAESLGLSKRARRSRIYRQLYNTN
jgi:transposase